MNTKTPYIKNRVKIALPFLIILSMVLSFGSCNSLQPVLVDDSDVVVLYDTIIDASAAVELHPMQVKYGRALNIKPDSLTNIKLYTFIDEWMNRPYLLGGETVDGIDCSSFTQLLYINVNDLYLERTAEKQFKSRNTVIFQGQEFLEEGDLVFFQPGDKKQRRITHVGVYLRNGKFISSTSYVKDTGGSGVKISDLDHPFWKKRYLAGGKRKDLINE